MKIAVLISGGVDSAVVVHKLFKEGHELHLFYIRIGMKDGEGDCSADEDIEICQLIADKYNLPFEVVSLQDEYWEHVMKYTLETVKKGLTPHPDIMCNKIIKFGFFEEKWGKNFDKTATGHYASIKEIDGLSFLATAKDPVKDQTDFLAQISYKQLQHLIFPLGDIDKSEVRELARIASLPNARRKDSQGICFLGKINYSDFLAKQIGTKTGAVIDISTGKKIGSHNGYWFYTIGQRKGLGLSGGPWFVVKKNVRDNVIYVSHGLDTPLQYGRDIFLSEPNWITVNPLEYLENATDGADISFKTRHSPDFHKGKLFMDGDENLRILSSDDIQGIAPGQYAIIYDSKSVICFGSAMIVAGKPRDKKKDLIHNLNRL